MLSDSVVKRRAMLQSELTPQICQETLLEYEDQDDDKKSSSSESITLNLESVILLENKLSRIAQTTKTIRQPCEG